jgi:hypothetical protein
VIADWWFTQIDSTPKAIVAAVFIIAVAWVIVTAIKHG